MIRVRKSRLRVSKHPIISVKRPQSKPDRSVYLAIASKPLRYRYGRSRIAYIGTTRAGIKRIAASAAEKAPGILTGHGIKQVDFYIVSSQRRQRVMMWRKLERGLMLAFRERYGQIPQHNSQGDRFKWTDELSYFTRSYLDKVIARFSAESYRRNRQL